MHDIFVSRFRMLMVVASKSAIASSLVPHWNASTCGSGLAREEASTANTNAGNDKGHPKVAFVSRVAS